MRPTVSGPLRLTTTLRGDGALLWGKASELPVFYAIDIFSQGPMRLAHGDVRGDLQRLVGRVPVNVRLRLADGEEVRVTLSDIEADVASIELPAPPSAAAPAPKTRAKVSRAR